MTEYENKNSARSYPFSSGSSMLDMSGISFPTDVFVDAILYPLASETVLRLVSFDSATGVVVVSVGSSEYTGQVFGKTVELGTEKHLGTLVCGPGMERELASGRNWKFEDLRFSASCTVPVVLDCVTGVFVEGTDLLAEGGAIALSGEGRLEVTTNPEDNSLQFNVRQERADEEKKDTAPKLKTLVVAAQGATRFNLTKTDVDSVLVTMDYLTTEDVCYHAHREDAVAGVVDVCSSKEGKGELSCGPISSNGKPVTTFPKKGQSFSLKGCGVALQAYDLVNYRNPVKISTVEGITRVNFPILSLANTQEKIGDEIAKLGRSPTSSGNGIKIEIPGAGA